MLLNFAISLVESDFFVDPFYILSFKPAMLINIPLSRKTGQKCLERRIQDFFMFEGP